MGWDGVGWDGMGWDGMAWLGWAVGWREVTNWQMINEACHLTGHYTGHTVDTGHHGNLGFDG